MIAMILLAGIDTLIIIFLYAGDVTVPIAPELLSVVIINNQWIDKQIVTLRWLI